MTLYGFDGALRLCSNRDLYRVSDYVNKAVEGSLHLNNKPPTDVETDARPLTAAVLLRDLTVIGILTAILIVIRGVGWDESYEHSLIKLGRATYPEGHPLPLSLSRDRTIQDYPQMAMLALGSGPLLPNAIRNWMFLMGTMAPVYLGVYFVTRNRLWSGVAVLLSLQGIYLGFDSVYNLYVWHVTYSYGPIGTGFALLAVVLLAGGYLRCGVALSALMIQIHIGQLPALGLLCVAVLARAWLEGERKAVLQAFGIGCVIAVACGALWIWQSQNAIPIVKEEGPYYHEIDPWEFWRGAVPFADYHRRLPAPRSHAILTGALIVLAMLSTHSGIPHRARSAARTLFLYCGFIAILVWPIAIVHGFMGMDTPFLVLVWLPYRLMNHAAPLALIGVVAALSIMPRPAGFLAIAAALVLQLLWFVPAGDGTGPIRHWIESGFAPSYFLFGAALACLILNGSANSRSIKRLHAAIALGGIALLGVYHAVPFILSLSGAATAGAMVYFADRDWMQDFHRATVVGTVAVLIAALLCVELWETRRHLFRNHVSVRVEQALDDSGNHDAVILTRPSGSAFLSDLGYPTLLPEATRTVFGYMPELGPTIVNPYSELYGIQLMPPEEDRGKEDPTGWTTWWEGWPERSPEEWHALAERFGFDYVFIGAEPPLQLPVVLEGQGMALYDARRPTASQDEQ